MDKKRDRESNIELLRILAMLGVIILHYNNRDIGGGLLYTQDLSLNHAILLMFESISICAVDLFIMISGYFLVEKNERNFLKVFQLVFQVSVFKVIIYLVREGLGQGGLTLKGIIGSLIPNNYFVILYCVLFVLSPLINFSIAKVSKSYQLNMIIFLKIDIGSIKIINSLSKACFTCFLTHTLFLKFAGIRSFSTGNPVVLIVHVVLTGVAVFMICYVVDFAYSLITSFIWTKLDYEKFMIKYEDEK